MNVERRLHHAARELRGVEIEPPDLRVGGRRRRSLVMTLGPVVGAGFALVLGIAVVRSPADAPQPTAVVPRPPDVVVDAAGLPTPVQELAIIRSLSGDRVATSAATAAVVRAPAGVS